MGSRYEFKLSCYNGSNEGNFYIQSKGLHAGRPLRAPIPNCFVCNTSIPFLFERIYSMYVGRYFEPIICGSVVPFIRIDETREVINTALDQQPTTCEKELETINKIDCLLKNMQEQLAQYKAIQKTLCRKINGKEYRG